jgi:hypothetical protein
MCVGQGSRFVVLSLALACALLPLSRQARAQDSQQSSVADAARRAKQKKNAAAKASKVIDDDNLSSNLKSGGPDVTNVGASASATANPADGAANAQPDANENAGSGAQPGKDNDPESAKQADSSRATQDDGSAKESNEEDAEIAKVKAQVAETEKELDLLKRGFALDSDAYYSKTGYSSDKAGKAKLDDEQQQIAEKQHEVEQVKARLAELQEERSRRGKTSGAAGKQTTPPSQ